MAKYKGSWLEFSDLRLRVNDLEQEVERLKLAQATARQIGEKVPAERNEMASFAGVTIVNLCDNGHLVHLKIHIKPIPE